MRAIMFVCHGNICRSPTAEFVMKDILEKRGKGKDFSFLRRRRAAKNFQIPYTLPRAECLKGTGSIAAENGRSG